MICEINYDDDETIFMLPILIPDILDSEYMAFYSYPSKSSSVSPDVTR